jgi:adenosylmethionine-8-amino-7-oxononanoate aminotransferase
MKDLIILGTDTDAGKTTFALLWLAAFADQFDYWKPLETGESDSDLVRRLVPGAVVHPALQSFDEPVAPLLAARRSGVSILRAEQIAAGRPASARALLIETFGGPFSPLNEDELQLALIKRLGLPCVLVTPSAVGAVGRTLQSVGALAAEGVKPRGVVLIGASDPFAREQLQRHGVLVWELQPPTRWDAAGIRAAAENQGPSLLSILAQCIPHALREVTVSSPHAEREEYFGEDYASIAARDRRAVWHPYTSLRDAADPLVCVAAQDEFLHLADGRKVIDAISSWWTILHGHRHPVLMQALRDAAQHFDHVHFAGVTHAPAVELAERMLATTPWPAGRVFYSDNGSTAVEVALKMAYQFWCHRGEPQRARFIGFQHGYHGDTFGAMAVSRDPVFFGRFEPLLFSAAIVPLDANQLDAEFTRHRDQVAAIIVEPLVQGAGGMRMHSPAQLQDLVAAARRHGVLVIADEVMTGNRLGTRWAHQIAGIVPDLVCAGKTLTGGVLPLAATLAAPQVVEAFDTPDRTRTLFHGHSFTAHPLACAVAVANWKLPLPPIAPLEAFWREALAPLQELPRVRDMRVRGSIAAVELAVEGGYLADVGRRLRQVCLEAGVLIRPLGNVLYAMPPFGTRPESLQQMGDAMRRAVLSAHV